MGRQRSKNFLLPAGVRVIGRRYYWQATSAVYRKARAAAGEPHSVPLGPVGEETEMRRRWAVLEARYPSRSFAFVLPRSTAVPESGSLIYFLRAGRRGFVKIGYSSSARSLVERITSLQIGNAVKVKLIGAVRGTRDDEKAAHFDLRHHRMSGEWFANKAAVTSYVRHALILGRIPGDLRGQQPGPIAKSLEIVKEKALQNHDVTAISSTPR